MKGFSRVVLLVAFSLFLPYACAGESADDLISKGRVFESAGRYEEALRYFNDAIGLRPNESYVYLPKMDLVKKLGRYDEAEEVWTSVIDNLPHSTEPVFYYYFVPGGSMMCADYHARGKNYIIYHQDYNEALFYFKRVHELCPNDTDIGNVYADEAFAYYKLGQYTESLKSYDMALEHALRKLASVPDKKEYMTNYNITKFNREIVARKASSPPSLPDTPPPDTPAAPPAGSKEAEPDVTVADSGNSRKVPLPGSLFLIGAGLAVLGLRRRD